jgi:hypothetical protein
MLRRNTKRNTRTPKCVIHDVIQSVISTTVQYLLMAPILTARISEGMKSEIEELVDETGLWPSRTEFIKEALDQHIKKYWTGDRYASYSRHVIDEER